MSSRVSIIGPFKIIKTLSDSDTEQIKKSEKESLTIVQGLIPIGYFPSVNHMYGVNKWGGKYLYPEWAEIRAKAQTWLGTMFPNVTVPDDIRLSISLGFMMRYDINRKDLDNMQKFIIDTLAGYFGFNDNRIFDSRAFKAQIANEGYKSDLLFFRIEKNPKSDEQVYIDLNKLECL